MLARLFQITLITFFVIFTVAFLVFIFIAGMSVGFISSAQTGGITAIAGGFSSHNLSRALVLIPIILFVVYLAFRRSKIRR